MTRSRKKRVGRLRRVSPMWLVLASLALGLLATAASVIRGSRHICEAIFFTSGPGPVAWEAEIDHGEHVERVVRFAQRGGEVWASRSEPSTPRPVWVGQYYPSTDAGDDLRPAFARTPHRNFEQSIWCIRAGWPFLAAEGRDVYGFPPPGSEVARTHEVSWLTRKTATSATAYIPFRPIWPGLLANTLFYAVPAALLLTALRFAALGVHRAFRSARGRRRQTRGRCAHCGYEPGQGITTCPECGRTRKPG